MTAPGVLGHFTPTVGWEDLYVNRQIDMGPYYASKDSLYPTAGSSAMRRINWGWARVDAGPATFPPSSTQSLPREITFNAATRTLEQAPIAELDALRDAAAYELTVPTTLHANQSLLLPVSTDVVRHCELILTFTLPTPRSTGSRARGKAGEGAPVSFGVSVGNATELARTSTPAASEHDEHEHGEHYEHGVPSGVEERSRRRDRRQAHKGSTPSSALSCLFTYAPPNRTQSAAAYYDVHVSCAGQHDTLRVLTASESVSLRLFIDATFVEAYFEDGRVAMTAAANLQGEPQLALTTSGDVQLARAVVYPIRPIWTTPDAVRAAPRVFH
jgi:hypothetical protein